jgi:hypothetical protein
MIVLVSFVLPGCKVEIAVPEGGRVETRSGALSCESGNTCLIDVVDVFFDETFVALPKDGYTFIQWQNRYRGFCGGRDDPCNLTTTAFPDTPLEQFLESEEVFFLEPVFWQSNPWTRLGDDLEGNPGDFFGYSVSLSADGNRMAIGATGINPVCTSCNDELPGYVRVYVRSSGNDWRQLGRDIVADRGASVSLSADGKRVAIGEPGNSRVRVYKSIGTDWIQVGGDIVGEARRFLGESVSLSANGNRVAAGAVDGRVRVYAWSGTDWTLLGGRFPGGGSPVLSASGNRLATASVDPGDTPPTGEPDTVWVYKWNDGQWQRLGGDIVGSRSSYSLSARGNRLAVVGDDGLNGAMVLKWSGTAWTPLGARIEFGGEGYSGFVASISADGNRLALGARGKDDSDSTSPGYVRIYTYSSQSDSWRQVSQEIVGNDSDAFLGLPVALSADGSRVAIGAPWSELAEAASSQASSPGRVRVWERPL